MDTQVSVYLGSALAQYGFDDDHPFSRERHAAFEKRVVAQTWWPQVSRLDPVKATEQELKLFHTADYIQTVKKASDDGQGYLDGGDTPAFLGAFEAASHVVGTTLHAVRQAMGKGSTKAFVPIAGLHHARPNQASGFCIFNDCAIAALALHQEFGLSRVAYVDIDAHHGDGVFYGLISAEWLTFADIHEDGRYLYPGTGDREETGSGEAEGTKLNIPLAPGAGDEQFLSAWAEVEEHLMQYPADFFLLQCGADSLAGDPLTHLQFSADAHAHAARRLCYLAELAGHDRVVAMGGGGYNLENLAAAWTAVVGALMGA